MRKTLLLLFLLLGGLSRPSHGALLASDIISRARTLLKDSSTAANRQQFSDTQYLQWASDGQREANAQNWVFQSSVTFSLVAGQAEYQLPSDFMFVNRVWYQVPGQPFTKLPSTSYNDLDARSPGWNQVTGTAISYYIDQSTGSVYMGIYPIPTATSTGTVVFMYVQNTVDLSASNESAIPFNSWLVAQPYVSALPYYMAYRAYLTLEETELSQEYLKYWVNFLLLMRQGLNRQPDFNPPAGALRSGSPGGMGGLGGP